MKKLLLFLSFSFLCLLGVSAVAAGLQPLDDARLAAVTGREGVAIDFDYGMNAFKEDVGTHKRGDPLTGPMLDPTDPALATGTYLTNGCQQVSNAPNPCSMAIATNNRPGMWVMLKDMYATMKVNNLWLDAGRVTGDTNGPGGTWQLSLPGNKALNYPTYSLSNANYDETRFYDLSQPSGSRCLIAGKSEGNCNMQGLPALTMQYDPDNLTYAGVDADVTWHLYVGRVAVQYDNGSTPAFMTDQTGSFMSYQISDFNQNEAKIHYGGRVMMFGF